MQTLYQPDLIYDAGNFKAGHALLCAEDGTVQGVLSPHEIASSTVVPVRMAGRAILPGLVNAHSHTFQRLIRGRSENRGLTGQDFWSWRTAMYAAAGSISPDDLYAVSRMAFLEMAAGGITTVGEFHYLHRAIGGSPYSDPNLLAKQVVRAAESVGIRIAILRVAYFRSGFSLPPHPGQQRFIESLDEYLANCAALASDLSTSKGRAWLGIAPHSIRAVPLQPLREITAYANASMLPLHMHVAEQPAELSACRHEYGKSPVELLAANGVLSRSFTGVHLIHVTTSELDQLSAAGSTICSCPTTERNLGDGIVAAAEAITRGIQFAFGSDSQAQIDLFEDARELDYHLRLAHQQRVLLDRIGDVDMSRRLFEYATTGGAQSLGFNGGDFAHGRPADFFSIDLDDFSIAGASPAELLPMIVFGLNRTAIRDVVVGGRRIIENGSHLLAREIVADYKDVYRKIWKQ